MNVELILNLLQLLATLGGALYVGILFRTEDTKQCFLGMGFLLSLTLGNLYWFSYQMLMSETPQYFYISDVAWIASYLFLISLELYICTKEEKEYHHTLCYLSFVIGICLILYFNQWGYILLNILYVSPLSLCMYLAMRSLLYTWRTKVRSRYMKLHVYIIIFVCTEYALWLSSCFWISDTWTNPYFWFDIALTMELIVFAFLMKEVCAYD